MYELYLFPETIAYLAMIIFQVAFLTYLLRQPERTPLIRWAVAFYAFALLSDVGVFLYNCSVDDVWIGGFVVQRLGIHAALLALVQVSYHFGGETPQFDRERRWVLGVFGAILGVYLVYAAVAHGVSWRENSFPSTWASSLYLLFVLWIIGTCLRRGRALAREGRKSEARAAWTFALVCVPPIGSALSSQLMYLGLISADVFYSTYLFGRFFLLVGLAVLLVNYHAQETSFQVKLVGLSLVTVLAVLGVGSALTQRTGWLFDDADLRPEAGSGLRFTPRPDGGYRVEPRNGPIEPYAADAQVLGLTNRTARLVALPFPFSFYGTPRDHVFVNDDGLLTFDRPLRLARAAHRRLGGRAAIAPLHVDLRPGSNGLVWVRLTPEQAVFTWETVPHRLYRESVTVQAVLHASGAIDFRYGSITAALPLASRGLHPGATDAATVLLPARPGAGTAFDVPARAAVMTTYAELFGRYAHTRLLPLALLVLGSALFILFAFPLVFRSSLVRPLDRLLEGVERVERGERDVNVPVHTSDEVGRVTMGFNRMAQELQRYTAGLEAEVEARTAEVQRQNEQLREQANRLRELDAVKSRFFANLSHEFRTPLTLILGALERAGDGPAAPEATTAGAVREQARHMLRLIDELLDLARLEDGRLTSRPALFDLAALVRHAHGAFAQHAERAGIALRLLDSPEPLLLRADPHHVHKIVGNLLSNAIKFTPAGGRVSVAVRRGAVDAPDPKAVLVVRDDGIGIPAEEQERIFDRFYQLDASSTRRYGGVGIGLALAKELVEAHGGTIEVESVVGLGTTFTVRLPAAPMPEGWDATGVAEPPPWAAWEMEAPAQALHDPEETPPPSRPGTSPPARVLVVEDHAQLRTFIRSLLADAYAVEEAADGAEALAAIRRSPPDLLITDVMMPTMNGHDLIDHLRSDDALRAIPIIVLTAKKNEDDRVWGLRHGVDAYLFKPFEGDALRALVDNKLTLRHELRERYGREVHVGPSGVVVDSHQEQWLQQLSQTIDAHLADADFDAAALAAAMGTSLRTLDRKAKKLLKRTATQHLRMVRLERGKALLVQGFGQVQEVAAAVGYRDPKTFARHFKKAHGGPPSAFLAEGFAAEDPS